jgi:hypothetical protein
MPVAHRQDELGDPRVLHAEGIYATVDQLRQDACRYKYIERAADEFGLGRLPDPAQSRIDVGVTRRPLIPAIQEIGGAGQIDSAMDCNTGRVNLLRRHAASEGLEVEVDEMHIVEPVQQSREDDVIGIPRP